MSQWAQLRKAHARLKRTRHRGDPAAGALATQVYLRSLERELDRVEALLFEGRAHERPECLDQAQQRLHIVIKVQASKHRKKK